MQALNPFNYKLKELQKALFAGIPLAFIALTFILGWIPPVGLEGAVLALVPAAAMVVTVFTAQNHSAQQFRKALEAFTTAVITLVTYWKTVPVSWDNKIALAITLIVAIVGVIWSKGPPVTK